MQADTRTGQNIVNNNSSGILINQKHRQSHSNVRSSSVVTTKSLFVPYRVRQATTKKLDNDNLTSKQEIKSLSSSSLSQQRNKHKRKHGLKPQFNSNVYTSVSGNNRLPSFSIEANDNISGQHWRQSHNNHHYHNHKPAGKDDSLNSLNYYNSTTTTTTTTTVSSPLESAHLFTSAANVATSLINKKQLNSIVDYISRQQKQHQRQQQHLHSQYVNLKSSLVTQDNQQQQQQQQTININNQLSNQQMNKQQQQQQQKLISSSVPQSMFTVTDQNQVKSQSQVHRLAPLGVIKRPQQTSHHQ